tara:strand:- start:764 stop:1105 length:342 start_codon:yes stop_codon:yes gene_type:complete
LTFTPPTVSDVPLLFPIRAVVPAGTTRVISFPDEFLAIAVNLKITNNDAANAATYRYGGDALDTSNLPASNFDTISNTQVKLLSVTAGAAGTVLVEAQAYPIERTEVAGVVAT